MLSLVYTRRNDNLVESILIDSAFRTIFVGKVKAVMKDSSDCIDNRKRKRNQNFNDYIGTVKHRDVMAHVGIDFVLYEVILSVSNMVGTVSKSGGEIPRLESQIKDRILPTVPKKRKRTGKRLRVQRPLVERGISNIKKLDR